MADQQNNNNQNEVTREGFGTKVKNGLKRAWEFTGPARGYVLDVAGTMVCCAAAGAATVGGIVWAANKLNVVADDPDASDASDEEAVSVEDTTPDE